MERPAPDPTKLLEAWMEWERGETPPGRVMSNLKTGGMRDLLEDLASSATSAGAPDPVVESPSAEVWTPVV
jgi:hypothetical protein